MKSLHLLSVLLQYPSEDHQRAIGKIRDILSSDKSLPLHSVSALEPLLVRLANSDIYAVQEAYVELFDRGRALSLHLFEHVHGESRDRGQAMVDLRQRYLAAGLEAAGNELPDYIPLFLEYCSVLPEAEARAALAEPGLILIALAARLSERGSDYAPLFALLCDIAGVEMDEAAARALPVPEDPETLAELDAEWEEEEIRFASEVPDPGAACPQASAVLRRMQAADNPPAERRN